MNTIRAAFYARVSGEQQAAAHTIGSQIAALKERAHSDGTPVLSERQFVDDERERLRVFREHGGKHTWDNVPESRPPVR